MTGAGRVEREIRGLPEGRPPSITDGSTFPRSKRRERNLSADGVALAGDEEPDRAAGGERVVRRDDDHRDPRGLRAPGEREEENGGEDDPAHPAILADPSGRRSTVAACPHGRAFRGSTSRTGPGS